MPFDLFDGDTNFAEYIISLRDILQHWMMMMMMSETRKKLGKVIRVTAYNDEYAFKLVYFQKAR